MERFDCNIFSLQSPQPVINCKIIVNNNYSKIDNMPFPCKYDQKRSQEKDHPFEVNLSLYRYFFLSPSSSLDLLNIRLFIPL